MIGGLLADIAGEIIAEFVVSGKMGKLTDDVVKAGGRLVEGVGNAAQSTVDRLNECVASLTELSYTEAMGYFADHQHDFPDIAKGALLRRQEGGQVRIIQTFLDKNNKVVHDTEGKPLGTMFTVNCLDAELQAVFKQNDVVIVE